MQLKSFAFPLLPKAKIIKKKIIISGIIGLLVLAAIGGYFWLEKTGKMPEFKSNLSMLLGRLTLPGKEETETPVSLEESFTSKDFEKEVGLKSSLGDYEETAEVDDGITNLARKALKSYLKEKGENLNLTPEHKIYIEDYIQNKTGDRWLVLGEKLGFSKDLISEAINKSLELTPNQLENLRQYSALVSSL